MTIDEMNALGRNKDEIKQQLMKDNEMASKAFIQQQIKDAFNLGYTQGFKDAIAQYSVSQKEITAFKDQAARG